MRLRSDRLDYPRTLLVGLAFLSICAFWQMYDSIVPLILTGTFRMNETASGAIMAAEPCPPTCGGASASCSRPSRCGTPATTASPHGSPPTSAR